MSTTQFWILCQLVSFSTASTIQIQNLRNQVSIYSCLEKISTKFETCFREFQVSLEDYRLSDPWSSEEEKNRQFCCVQNQLKDCWTATIQTTCDKNETTLSRWLPVHVLSDLRHDFRCRSFVLYPHRCKTNTFSLFQILIFLLGVPFFSFVLIMFVLKWLKQMYGKN